LEHGAMADGFEKTRAAFQPLAPGFHVGALAALEAMRKCATALRARFDPARDAARTKQRRRFDKAAAMLLEIALQTVNETLGGVIETLAYACEELIGTRQCAR